MLSYKEKISYNLVNILLESNYQKINKLYNKYKSWEKILKSFENNKYNSENEYKKLELNKIKLILKEEKEYPKLLKEIPFPPFGIYVLGNLNILNNKSIAIVGTRKATQEGKITTKKFAQILSSYNLNIVSGLAIGIDSVAHISTIENNKITIAVLANSILSIYPKINKNLAQKIIQNNGTIISEYNIYSNPLPYKFLERNRIISGLCLGTLIIEAPEESGALNTARFTIEQNRELWIIPGSINNKNYAGSNKLIQNGAKLVISPKDILDDLNIKQNLNIENINLNDEEKIIYDYIKNNGEPISIDKLIEITNLKTQRVIQIISLLIIKNIIKETENGYIILK